MPRYWNKIIGSQVLSDTLRCCTRGPEAAVPDNVPAQRKARGGEHGFTEDSLRKEGPPVPPEIKAYCLV